MKGNVCEAEIPEEGVAIIFVLDKGGTHSIAVHDVKPNKLNSWKLTTYNQAKGYTANAGAGDSRIVDVSIGADNVGTCKSRSTEEVLLPPISAKRQQPQQSKTVSEYTCDA